MKKAKSTKKAKTTKKVSPSKVDPKEFCSSIVYYARLRAREDAIMNIYSMVETLDTAIDKLTRQPLCAQEVAELLTQARQELERNTETIGHQVISSVEELNSNKNQIKDKFHGQYYTCPTCGGTHFATPIIGSSVYSIYHSPNGICWDSKDSVDEGDDYYCTDCGERFDWGELISGEVLELEPPQF